MRWRYISPSYVYTSAIATLAVGDEYIRPDGMGGQELIRITSIAWGCVTTSTGEEFTPVQAMELVMSGAWQPYEGPPTEPCGLVRCRNFAQCGTESEYQRRGFTCWKCRNNA